MAGMLSTPNSNGRKRKASELNDESGMNGHGHPTNSTHKTKHSSKKKSDSQSIDTMSTPHYSVRIVGPAKKVKDGKQKPVSRHTIQIDRDFAVDYSVSPASWWQMKQYKNLKLQDITFSVGSIVYINSREDIPEPPPADASDAELLKYDRNNLWVARILDIRAVSDKAVYMLIAWLYWADELPMGRQPYHGDEEFVISNDMAIIDATTISSAADAHFWDEHDDNMVASRPERFWRQYYDVQAYKKHKRRLTEVRKHCRCRKPQHPDEKMWHCGAERCKTWNHEQCLVDDIGEQAWKAYESGKMTEFAKQNQEKSSFASRILDPMRAMGKFFEEKADQKLEDGITVVKNEIEVQPLLFNSPRKGGQSKEPPKTKSTRPWKDVLDVRLVWREGEHLHANVTDLQHPSQSWNVKVNCLSCGNTME